jgi:hypothetical protein
MRAPLVSLAMLSSLTCLFAVSNDVRAQPASTASAPATTKQAQRAQRKAERRAAHAKNKAEVGKLQQHGYEQNSDNTNYPQDLQNAQKKSGAASAP